MIFCPVGAELFHEDRQTHMSKLIVAFRNSANAPENMLYADRRDYVQMGNSRIFDCQLVVQGYFTP